MNLYTPGDGKGSFIVDAEISYIHGEPWEITDHDSQSLNIEIAIDEAQLHLTHSVSINTSSNELEFPLYGLAPRFEPYRVNLKANRQDGGRVYTATTNLYHLPERTDGGSITKLDSLYGGLLVQDYADDSSWSPLLPYSYYVSWDGYLEKSLSNIQSFKDQGYNIIHIVPDAGLANEAFNFTELGKFLNKCDEVGLWVMYDMRWTYENLTSVQYQVDILKTHKSMLLWYAGDEPDGQGGPTECNQDHVRPDQITRPMASRFTLSELL
ncbi:uncharacterized protein N7477_003637 [Penicillium maclennaniae]|uniref:uncharacterized protein n=1 Tax=Penicillium maclennaniae TaxID=1343394 RepID=UPI00254233FB|nr:uncharacterized protein N7477_003637 [Penicillium maclennaniae]KAJ5678004.1 hypothetical protein N7477_003637 [Penicillium maclennaniae]